MLDLLTVALFLFFLMTVPHPVVFVVVVRRNWWGESCCFCLGMTSRMVEEINRWINGEVED